DWFDPMEPAVRLRVVSFVIVGAVALAIALTIPDDYLCSFNSFVGLMLYFLIPWTAVNLVDFCLVRRGRDALGDIVSGNGVYGRWAWKGLVAYAVGFAAMIPFFSLSFYTGPAASAMEGADLSLAVGLLAAGRRS